jgi:hypothetical protein
MQAARRAAAKTKRLLVNVLAGLWENAGQGNVAKVYDGFKAKF